MASRTRAPRPGAVKRAKSIRNKRVARDFGTRFLQNMGFGANDFSNTGFVVKKLGLFGGAITSTTKSGSVDTGAMPTLETPTRVSNEHNPTITTIIKQLDNLVRTANKVGILTKEQQDALMSQLAQARRISKEQQLEAKQTAVPEAPQLETANALTPLTDVIQELQKKLSKLTDIVEEKVDEQDSDKRGFMERFMDNLDLGDQYRERKRRTAAREARIRTKPGYKLEYSQGRIKYRNLATGAYASEAEARLVRRPGIISRLAGKIESGVKASATAVRGTRLAATVGSSRIAKAIGGGVRAAGAAGKASSGALKATIKNLALPILEKGIGRTAIKSIPLIGAVAGAGFAISRLLDGDPVGAGLDLASGLGGPLTAIPALIASTARDIYSSVFGAQPEQDPQVGERMNLIMSTVEGLAKDMLGMTVDPKQKPTEQQIDKQVVPESPPAKPPGAQPPAPPQGGAKPEPILKGGETPTGEVAAPKPMETAPKAVKPDADKVSGQQGQDAANISPQVLPAEPSTGDILNAQAMPLRREVTQELGYNPQLGRFVPQRKQTDRSGSKGQGIVPNPVYIPSPYNLDAIKRTLFFDSQYEDQH